MKKLFTLFVSLWIAMASLFAVNMTGGEVLYLTPCDNWINNAKNNGGGKPGRYAAYFFNNSPKAEAWVAMTQVEGEFYQVTAPSGNFTNVIFCSMNPGSIGLSWNDKWNQTGDLSYDGTKNHYTVKAGTWGDRGSWSTYTPPIPDPVITIGAIPEIANTTVGETATATLTYTLENADKADVTIEGEGFAAVDNDGTITITFTPEEAGEYTATITITAGEVKETATITAIAIAAEAPKVIQILNVTGPVFEQTVVGESSTATVTYEVVNFDETPSVRVEGEGFVIAGEDEGSVNIMFEPQGAGEFNGTLTITAGEVEKLVPFSAIAVEPTPVVTIKVATPANWESCYIWAWTASGDLYDSFPGAEMTKGDDGFYFIDIETPEAISFLVSDNGADSKKTADYSDGVTESTCFDIDNNALVINSSCEYQDIPEPEPIEPYYAIRGLVSWNMADDIKMTYNADAANGPEWYITNLQVNAGAKFKVVSVDEKSAATWYGSDKVDLGEGVTNAGKGDGDIDLGEGAYDIYFKVNEGRMWIQKYIEPTPEPDPVPALTVSAEAVTFEELTLGEEPVSATQTITYTVENSEEAVVLALESDVFTAEDAEGTITITFAPTSEGEYTAELTLTLGDIVKTIAISGAAKAAAVEPEPEPTPELEFALVGRLNGDNDNEILDYESGYKFTKESEFVYTLNVTFTGTITTDDGKEVQKVKLVDAEGNIWARNSSKTIKPGDGTSTMTKGETGSSTYLQCEAGVEYKITYTLVSDPAEALYKLSGQITFEKVETEDPDPDPDPEPEPDPTPEYPKTITVKVACAWEACNIWAWYADGSGNVYTEWPGEAMTKGEDGFYAIDMTIASPVYFKVNAGLGKTESDNYMTELSESTCFNMDGLKLVVNEDCEYEEPIEIEPYYGIRGLVSWEMADDIKLTEDADKAEWYITNVGVDGTQEFKVVYVDKTGAATWYGTESVELQQGVVNEGEGQGNIILAAGIYDIYFKVNEGKMWIQFSQETPTDAEEAIAEVIYAIDGTIVAPAPFAIIDLSGKDVTNANGSLEGTYLVKTLGGVTKISVK